MRCCADRKDEDIEKQCSDQSNLPANQVCRYDVNTIECAPTVYRTTAPAGLVSTAPAIAHDKMAYRSDDRGSASTIWFIAVVACVAFTVCVSFGVMLFVCYRKQFLSQYLCFTRAHADGDCVTSTRKYLVMLRTRIKEISLHVFNHILVTKLKFATKVCFESYRLFSHHTPLFKLGV